MDLLNKHENWNEHPDRLPPSVLDDLQVPYLERMRDLRREITDELQSPRGKPKFSGNS